MSTRTVSLSSRVFETTKAKKQSSVFTKGKSDEQSSVSSTTSIQEIVEKVRSMKNYVHTPIKSLSSNKQKELEDLRKAASLLRKGKSYSSVVNVIKETFGDRDDIHPLTVGAFFYGCFMNESYDGCLACSAYCAGSMPVPATPGWKECDKSVAFYSNGKLDIRQINNNSDEVIIHTIDCDFDGISDSEVKSLNALGIKKAVVMSSSKSSGSKEIVSGTPTSLSRKSLSSETSSESSDNVPVSTYYPTSSSSSKSSGNESGWSWGIIAVVVIVVLLMLAAFAYFYYFRSVATTSEVSAPAVEAKTVTTTSIFSGPGYSM